MNTHLKIVYVLLFLAFFSCTNIPKGVIKMNKMENILVDIHTAEAVSEMNYTEYGSTEQKENFAAEILKKNGVTKAEFDSSLSFYSGRLDLYMKIYQKVSERLTAQKDQLKESVLAYERSLLTPYGDSVNIWKKSAQLILTPGVLGNKILEVKVDTNFWKEDVLELKFKLMNQPKDSNSYIIAALGNSTTNDNSTAISEHINKTGWYTLTVNDDEYKQGDNIFTSFTLIERGKSPTEIYIDSITLMRYHKKGVIHTVQESASQDSITASSDSLKNIVKDSLVNQENISNEPDKKLRNIDKNETEISNSSDSVKLLDNNSVNIKK